MTELVVFFLFLFLLILLLRPDGGKIGGAARIDAIIERDRSQAKKLGVAQEFDSSLKRISDSDLKHARRFEAGEIRVPEPMKSDHRRHYERTITSALALLSESIARHEKNIIAEAENEANAERRAAELRAKAERRDAHSQSSPYSYKIGRHANETLAIRYGIANVSKRFGAEEGHIQLQKIRPSKMLSSEGNAESVFLVQLTDFRNRQALAVIEKGTEYVKTFLPLDAHWFDLNDRLEGMLKGNSTMPLIEVAKFHIDKAVFPCRITNDC